MVSSLVVLDGKNVITGKETGPQMRYAIGVDIGGTQIRAALIDRDGTIHSMLHTLTKGDRGPQAVLDDVVSFIQQLRQSLPKWGTLLGVGVGCPGPLDPSSGTIFKAPNMPGWEQVPLATLLQERTGLLIRVHNDANVAVLGEWYYGGGKGYQHVVYITVSTGIGSGVIVDRQLVLGNRGAGAELGHMIIDVQNQKSWEELASGTAMKHAAIEAMSQYPDTLLHELATPSTITAADVAGAALRGDTVAQKLMHREAVLLGLGFVNVLHLFSPEIILVGGSVITCNPSLLDEAQQVVQKHVIADVYRHVPIEVAKLGDTVGVIGAGTLLFTE